MQGERRKNRKINGFGGWRVLEKCQMITTGVWRKHTIFSFSRTAFVSSWSPWSPSWFCHAGPGFGAPFPAPPGYLKRTRWSWKSFSVHKEKEGSWASWNTKGSFKRSWSNLNQQPKGFHHVWRHASHSLGIVQGFWEADQQSPVFIFLLDFVHELWGEFFCPVVSQGDCNLFVLWNVLRPLREGRN